MPTQPAVLGTARLGNFRLGYVPPALVPIRAARVRVVIGGAFANARVRRAGFAIHDAINDQPNTCNLTVDGTAPLAGQDLRVSINSDAPRLLFNGTIQTVDASYEGKPAQLAWACTATDDMARLNRRRPFGTWTNVSATTIAQYLVATFAPGFTSVNVAAALPAVSVTFDGSATFSSCMAQLAALIGGYFYVEDLDIHLFLTEATSTPDTIDGTPHRFLHEPPISARSDDSLLRTRVIGKGAGTTITADVLAGATQLPVQDNVAFENAAGQAIIGSTIISYSAKSTADGDGTVTTGPTASPSAPSASVSTTKSGGPLGAIAYYKIDVSADGPSEPSAASSTVTPATVSTPSAITNGGVQHTAVGTYNSTPKDYYTSHSVTLSRTGSSFSFTLAGAVAGARVRIFQSSTGAFDGIWTIASVSGSTVTVTGISTSAASSDTAYISFVTDGPLDGTYDYGVSFVSALGETAISSAKQVTAALHAGIGFNSTGIFTPQAGGNMTSSVTYRYWTTIRSQSGESSPIQIVQSAVMGGSDKSVLISFTAGPIATAFADLRAMSMGLYRSRAGGTTPFAVTTITREQLAQAGALDNSTNFTYTDTAADSSLTALPSNNPIGAAIGLWGITTTSDARATGRRLWRKLGGVWYPLALIGDRDTTNYYLDTTPDSELGRGAVGADPKPFGGAAVNVTVPVGASGTLLRRLYRAKAGPTSTAYFCGTLDGNVNTGYEDTKSDEDLGEEMPAYSKRRTLAGSTTLRVRDLSKIDTGATGGWIRSGSQVIKFANNAPGFGEGNLTGIPASGPGSITADISTDAEVTVEPQLIGVSGITSAITKGTPVRLYVVRNDTAAQAALIALDAAQGRVTDGVVESVLSEDVLTAELIARCDADLERYSTPLVTVTFDGRDPKLKSGKPITFNLTSPAIADTLTLMSVDISEIDLAPSGLAPRFHCVASRATVSLESILRRMLTRTT